MWGQKVGIGMRVGTRAWVISPLAEIILEVEAAGTSGSGPGDHFRERLGNGDPIEVRPRVA